LVGQERGEVPKKKESRATKHRWLSLCGEIKHLEKKKEAGGRENLKLAHENRSKPRGGPGEKKTKKGNGQERGEEKGKFRKLGPGTIKQNKGASRQSQGGSRNKTHAGEEKGELKGKKKGTALEAWWRQEQKM